MNLKKKNSTEKFLDSDLKSLKSKRLKTEKNYERKMSSRKISSRKTKKQRSSVNDNKVDFDILKKSDAFDYYGKYDKGKSSYESTFLF